MRNSTPRLHSVKMKSGGAKVRVFKNPSDERCAEDLRYACRSIEDARRGDMAGFVVVAWGNTGAVSRGVFLANTRPLGISAVPEFVRNTLIDHVAAL